MSKKSFILYVDHLEVLDDLTNEEAAQLFRAIRDYQLGNEVKLTGLMRAIFTPFKNQFERDEEKYQKIVNRNRENGSKGGRPNKPNKPNGFSNNPSEPKKADNDNDNVNDNVTVNDISSKEEKKDTPPEWFDFLNFAEEKAEDLNLEIDHQKLKAKYLSWQTAGWCKTDKKGKLIKIKNWKSTLLNTLIYLQKEKNSAQKEKVLTVDDLMSDEFQAKLNQYK